MFERGTLKVLAILMLAYGLLYLPARIWPAYADSPIGLLFAVPFISVYAFHALGIPGLLQHDGACGWGWCAPTPFGWAFLAAFWIGLAWLAARAIASWRSFGS
jgi:hypothetical protein